MDQEAKAKFILALHKHSLRAFDSGGGVVGGGGSGGVLSDISGALTTQNTYNANSPTDVGTIGAQQAQLAGQLQNEAAGNGPNPAQIQFLQNSDKLAQQQAMNYSQNRALNPGLAARLSAQNAANMGQTAAGTAAVQQAQQQLAAQGEMANLTGQEQQGAMTAQGLNAQVSQNNANAVNQNESGLVNGIAGALTGPLGSFFAKGGMIEAPKHLEEMGKIYHPHRFAGGGLLSPGLGGSISDPDVPSFSNAAALKATPPIGFGGGGGDKPKAPSMPGGGGAGGVGQDASVPDAAVAGDSGAAAGGASAADLVSVAALAAKGGKVKAASPQQKAVVPGNSLKNDKIPALLSEGEEVLPREVMQSKDPVKAAAAFVRAEIAKRGLRGMHGLNLSKPGGKK